MLDRLRKWLCGKLGESQHNKTPIKSTVRKKVAPPSRPGLAERRAAKARRNAR